MSDTSQLLLCRKIEAMGQFEKRVGERIRDWGVVVHDTLETQSSFIAFGKRGDQSVALKVIRHPGDEWRCGEVFSAFGGRGMARVYEYIEGAALLERLNPGTSLASIALDGRDEEATEILADVIDRMSRPLESLNEPSTEALKAFVSAQDWGKGFHRYLESGDRQIPASLVEHGQRFYFDLCASQRGVRLLHGDLQHYNVLFDSNRGWLAIDPKGVMGEIEYEIGACLRNPIERPELFASPEAVERRLRCFEASLNLNSNRALAWGFAQAVLSAIWSVEDGFAVDAGNPSLLLKHINTAALEYAACISPDELELFFTRVGKSGPAIYRSTRKNVTQPFDPPERVAAIRGFVEAPTLSSDGRSLYYHLKEGERFVIYRVTRSP